MERGFEPPKPISNPLFDRAVKVADGDFQDRRGTNPLLPFGPYEAAGERTCGAKRHPAYRPSKDLRFPIGLLDGNGATDHQEVG